VLFPASCRVALSMAACLVPFAATVHAADSNAGRAAAQAQLRLLSEDLGSMVAYKPLIPSGGTGIVGFDVGAAVLVNQVRNRDAFALVAGQDVPATVQYALRVNKGLPMDLDIGASASKFVGVNLQVLGADLRWAALNERTYLPAVSVRAAFSQLEGNDQLDLRTVSYDLALSKTFAFITPYVGLGQVQVSATPNVAGAPADNFNLLRVFGGTSLTLRPMNLVVEVDKTGDAANLGVKLGLRY
jgi:hypothetical protein